MKQTTVISIFFFTYLKANYFGLSLKAILLIEFYRIINNSQLQLIMDSNPKAPLSDGNFLPLIGLGLSNFKPNDKTFNLNDFLLKAANAGYTHFDITNNQQAIGDAFKLIFQFKKQLEDEDGEKIPDQFEVAFPRQKLFFTYKVYNTQDIQKNIKTALQSLRIQYFDLVLLNCPTSPPPAANQPQENAEPPADNAEEKVEVKRQSMKSGWKLLENCRQNGLTKSIGVSNFSCQALLNLVPFVKNPPVVNQVESHPYLIQKNLYNLCKKLKIVMVAYCPLMRGGKDQKQPLGDKIDYVAEPILKQLANKYAKSIQQVILNYQICRGVGVIPKTEKLDHLNDNMNITDFSLLQQDIAELQSLDKGGKLKVYQYKNLPIWRNEDPLC